MAMGIKGTKPSPPHPGQIANFAIHTGRSAVDISWGSEERAVDSKPYECVSRAQVECGGLLRFVLGWESRPRTSTEQGSVL